MVEVVTGGVDEVLLTGGEEVDTTQLPRRSSRQFGGMDDVGDGEELVVGGVDVGVSVVGDVDGEELPGSVVGVVVGEEEEEVSLVDGGGVVDGVLDDEGVVLVDGGSVVVGREEGLVEGGGVEDEGGGVEDEEVGPVENIKR